MDFFNVLTVEEGQRLIWETFGDFQLKTEEVDILEAAGRTLAADVCSGIQVPAFNRSTVDGYGIAAQDSHGATETIPSILDLDGEIKMGEFSERTIASGQAVYIPTGGMVPQGATGVVMIEHTEKMDERTLLIYKPVAEGENMVYAGDDIQKGEVVLQKGRKIGAEAVGVLAALGIPKVLVYQRPSVYLISTGDEIIGIEEELKMGQIRDINSYALQILVEQAGGRVSGRALVRDDEGLLRAEVATGLALSDLVLLSGGSSVGTRDYTDKVIHSFGGRGVLAHGLSIKPGKPTIIGECEGKLVLGLPGHPVSSIVVFKALVEDFLLKLLGNQRIKPSVMAVMDYNFPSSPGKETYQMVKLREEDGRYFATPTHGKSGMISLLSDSDGYLVLKMHEEGVYKGETRQVFLL